MKRKIFIACLAVLALLIITNPSDKDFKSYMKLPAYYRGGGIGRDANFFVASTYSYGDNEKYLAIAGNFFLLSDTTTKK